MERVTLVSGVRAGVPHVQTTPRVFMWIPWNAACTLGGIADRGS